MALPTSHPAKAPLALQAYFISVGVVVLMLGMASLHSLSIGDAALFMAAALLVLASLTTFMSKPDMVTEIAFPMALIFAIQIVVYPGFYFRTGNFRWGMFQGSVIPPLRVAFAIWLASFAAFLVGRTLVRRGHRTLSFREFQIPPDSSPMLASIPLVAMSLMGIAFEVLLHGGLGAMMSPEFASDGIRRARGLGVLEPMKIMSYVVAAYIGWQAALNRGARTRLYVFAVAASVLCCSTRLLMARRSALVVHFALILLPFLYQHRRSAFRFAIPLVVFGMMELDDYTGSIRELYFKEGRVDLVEAGKAAWGGGREDQIPPASFDQLQWTAAIVAQIETRSFHILYGRTFINGALNWIPRRLFPDKGWTAGPIAADALASSPASGYSFDDSRASSSLTTGLVLESVMNFPPWCAPPIAFLAGYLVSLVAKCIRGDTISATRLTVWSLCAVYSWALFADDFGGFTTKVVSLTPGVVLLSWMRRRLRPKLRRSGPATRR